jgi:hypothetical protein
MQVKLLKNIETEDELIPAGTICEVEQSYPANGDMRPTLDLLEPQSGAIFWVFTDEAEEIKPA